MQEDELNQEDVEQYNYILQISKGLYITFNNNSVVSTRAAAAAAAAARSKKKT